MLEIVVIVAVRICCQWHTGTDGLEFTCYGSCFETSCNYCATVSFGIKYCATSVVLT